MFTVHASKSALDVGSVSLKSSYVCATGETIKFENNSQLVMKDLQYQAIQIDGSKYATGILYANIICFRLFYDL